MGKNMHGADGDNLVIKVPVGTVVRQVETDWTDTWMPGEAREDLYSKDERLVGLLKHFKFRKGYVPLDDRIKMLQERIPYKSKRKAPLIEIDLIKDGQKHLIRFVWIQHTLLKI